MPVCSDSRNEARERPGFGPQTRTCQRADKSIGRGFTLIEVIVGTALMLIIFIGIYEMILFSFKMVAQSKARITATALANEKIELARNLSYNQVGTVGGIPSGSIPENETDVLNGITYTVKTTVVYIDDPFDNLFPADPLPWDYKRVKVAVSWGGFLTGDVSLLTDVAPQGIETTGSGGVISVLVFNANGQPIPQADVHVENASSSPPINVHYETDNQGRLYVPGAPACNNCYKITATKTDYSADRTYAVGEQIHGAFLATPLKPFLSVIEGKLSEISFSIDQLATKNVQTLNYVEEKNWSDSFGDLTKIDSTFQTVASTTEGAFSLDQTEGNYYQTGYLVSVAITPTSLNQWGRITWNESVLASTTLKYQLLYSTSSDWVLIPDSDLTVGGIKNSDGFSNSPVNLIGLDPAKYESIKLKANFSSDDASSTPTLFDWAVTWFSSDTSIPVSNLAFTMKGAKTLGVDVSGQPIYKYAENLSTNASGQLTIAGLEWDSYKITVVGALTGYDIANSSPAQPVIINPAENKTTILRLVSHQANNILVTVKNAADQALGGANVQLHKSGYDNTELSSDSGQAFFGPLGGGTYTLSVTMAGFQDWSQDVTVAGQTEQTVTLTIP